MNEASSLTQLYAERGSSWETAMHACWCPRGSMKGVLRDRVPPKSRAARPTFRTSTAPVRQLTGQDAGSYNPWKRRGPKEDEIPKRSRRPSRPGPKRGARAAAGLRPLPGPFLIEHCPSFTNPAARRGHQIPCLFWTLFPFGHYFIISVK